MRVVVPAGGSIGRATVVATAVWARALSSARALSVAAVATEPCCSLRSTMTTMSWETNYVCVM